MRDSKPLRALLSLPVITAFSAGALALAPFNISFTAPFHGAACTEYSAWESFTQPDNLPNAPDDPTTTSGDSSLVQLTPGAVITSNGNIDHLSMAPSYRLTDSVPADLQELVLQISINLNQFDWSSFVLRYTDPLGATQSIAPAQSTFLVHLMGHDERVITWDLTGVSDTVLSYRIEFAAAFPSTTLDALKVDTRFACSTGVVSCAGDGSGSACPCQNGLPGRGCENSFTTGGGALTGSGLASVSNDSFVLTASSLPPSTPLLFFQGDAQLQGGAGLAFGDGLRCAGGTVVRLGTKTASGGTASFGHGVGVDPDISVKGVIPGPGATRYYQAWYRNVAVFCTPSSFNLTNGLAITW